jgi:predicted RNA polymerase sigma factor
VDELGTLLKAQRRRWWRTWPMRLGLAHLALAEDAVQAASLRALERWPVEGRPAQPGRLAVPRGQAPRHRPAAPRRARRTCPTTTAATWPGRS